MIMHNKMYKQLQQLINYICNDLLPLLSKEGFHQITEFLFFYTEIWHCRMVWPVILSSEVFHIYIYMKSN